MDGAAAGADGRTALLWRAVRPSPLLYGGVPDAVGGLDQGLADAGEAPVQLTTADDLAEVVDGEQGGGRLAVDPLDLAPGLDGRVGRRGRGVVAGAGPVLAEALERGGELADAVGQEGRALAGDPRRRC
jgi:hypothetical protein